MPTSLASLSRLAIPGSRARRRQAVRQAAAALMQARRFDEADSVLEEGLAAFPGDRELLVDHALSAHQSGRYGPAVTRWEAALRVAPDVSMCHAGLAANLRETGAYERAQAAIDAGLARFPADLAVVTEAARLAASRGRFHDALRHWQTAAAAPRPHPDWLQGHAQALVLVGAFTEAETALAAAQAAYPEHMGLCGVEGLLASARQDWPRAVALWTAYRRRFPNDPTGWQQLGLAVQGSGLVQAADCAAPPGPVAVEVVEDEALRALMLRFESLGDNCEFGLVQRRFGAEPLSLLRWNNVAFDSLIAALAAGFDGMGEESHTEMTEAANGEYFVQDRRWHLGMHTFLYVGQTAQDVLYAKMCRRVAYLRDKLIGDLAAAEKIFVFRSAGLDGEQLDTLHRALCAFGPVTLLAVAPTGDAVDVVKLGDRRLQGYVSRSGVDATGTWNIAFDDWVAICRKAAALA